VGGRPCAIRVTLEVDGIAFELFERLDIGGREPG
jgi:hypothetical protein